MQDKLVSLFGSVYHEHTSDVDVEPAPELWRNIKFWHQLSVFRDDPMTLVVLRYIAPSIFENVCLSDGSNTPLHTALWTQCGVKIVQVLVEHNNQWLNVLDTNGQRPVDLIIVHLQEVDLFECVFVAMPSATWMKREGTSLQLAAIEWKSGLILSIMLEHKKAMIASHRGDLDKIGSTARLLFEKGYPSKEVLELILECNPHMVLRVDHNDDTLLHTAINSGRGDLIMVVLSFMTDETSIIHSRKNQQGLIALEVCLERYDVDIDVVQELITQLSHAMWILHKSLFRPQGAPHVESGVRFQSPESWDLNRRTISGYNDSLYNIGGMSSKIPVGDGSVLMSLQTMPQAKRSFSDAMDILSHEPWLTKEPGSEEVIVYLSKDKARCIATNIVRGSNANLSLNDLRKKWLFLQLCLRAFEPEICDDKGITLMHIAGASRADIKVVKVIEKIYGMDVYLPDHYGNTPLHYMLIDPELSNVLPRYMTPHAPREVFGVMPPKQPSMDLLEALKTEGLIPPAPGVVAHMLESDPEQAKVTNNENFTLLSLAPRSKICINDFKNIYRANKQAVWLQGGPNNKSMLPIHYACCMLDLAVVAKHAKTTKVNQEFTNTLELTEFRAMALEFLIEVNPESVFAVDDIGRTPLHVATKTCAPLAIILILLRHTKRGRTQHPRTKEVVWEYNVLDQKDETGNTPLAYALMAKRRMFAKQDEIAVAMLHDGVCMSFRNGHGLSYYHLALLHGYVGKDTSENQDSWSVATRLNVERTEDELFMQETVCYLALKGLPQFLENTAGVSDPLRYCFEMCSHAVGAPHLETFLKVLDLILQHILEVHEEAFKHQPSLIEAVCNRMLTLTSLLTKRTDDYRNEQGFPDAPEHRKIFLRMKVISMTIESCKDRVTKKMNAEIDATRLQQELLQALADEEQAGKDKMKKKGSRQNERKNNRKIDKKAEVDEREKAEAAARSLREAAAAENRLRKDKEIKRKKAEIDEREKAEAVARGLREAATVDKIMRKNKEIERKKIKKLAVENAKTEELEVMRVQAETLARVIREEAAAEEERVEQQMLLDSALAAKYAADEAQAGSANPRPVPVSLTEHSPLQKNAQSWVFAPGDTMAKENPPRQMLDGLYNHTTDVWGPLDLALRLRELETDNARVRELETENARLVAENARLVAEAQQTAESVRQPCCICFGEKGLVDHVLTNCGHVFCETCIGLSLAKGDCFTCRMPTDRAIQMFGL